MDSLRNIPGIGERREKLLNKLGIFSISDLIEYYPRDYKDRTKITKISELKNGETVTLLCRIKQKPENIRIKSLTLTKTKIEDETGAIDVVWFNMPYLKNHFKEEDTYYFVGAAGERLGRRTLISPEFERFEGGESLSHSRIVPVYRVVKGLTPKALRQAIHTALQITDLDITDYLPEEIIKKNNLFGKKHAINNIHFPETNEAFIEARKRLCFDELFILQTALQKFKAKRLKDIKGFRLDDSVDYDDIIKKLPYSLTKAQQHVLSEIKGDMQTGNAMNRLIQGDVGSGKTAVALIAAFWTIQNGYQCALMAPTEVLASQHFESVSRIFGEYGILTVLLKGSMPKKHRDAALSDICSGKAKMVIGTHAVIQKAVIFNRLGLVITDEQHRFGVKQRGALQKKGENPHAIVMTATPIPRTLALILYGDLDISIINELPPGRREIDTYAVTGAYRKRVYDFIKKQIADGRQAYIICPAIENSDSAENGGIAKIDMLYVKEYIEELRGKVFANYNAAALHGKMKPSEKENIMKAFSNGEIDVLVSTTVIEVGVNVPNASVMVIENAERFGLSQLHQLRGRVGRGAHKSYCILISDSESETARERLETMKKTSDGFAISEMDLKLRGSGDFFGTRQHGLPEMKIANMFKDVEVLKIAQKSAMELALSDPSLEKPENKGVAEEIDKMFSNVKFGVNL